MEKTKEERITLSRQEKKLKGNAKECKKHEETTTETDKQPPLHQQNDEGGSHGSNIGLVRDLGLLSQTGLRRKEFKIREQVWETDQRDKLSFISLTYQIKTTKQADYEEREIVSTVIGSLIPSLILRSVLEATPDVTIYQLLQYLEAHFGEQNITDLFNSLTSMVQYPEDLRMLLLRGALK